MAKCDFTIDFTENVESLVAKAEQAIKTAGGKFNGDAKEGIFELSTPLGSVKGNYTISDQNIQLEIQDKPLFLGCGKIEAELRKYLST